MYIYTIIIIKVKIIETKATEIMGVTKNGVLPGKYTFIRYLLSSFSSLKRADSKVLLFKTKFLDLGRQPIANGFLTEDQFENEFFYDLSVGFDRETALVTHMEYVKPSLMFNDEYSYRGSMSNTMKLHFATFSKYVKQFLPKNIKF